MTPVTCLRVTLSNNAGGSIGRLLMSRVRSCSPVRCGMVRGLFPYQGAILNSTDRSIGPCNSSAASVVRGTLIANRIVGLYGDCHSAYRVASFTRGVQVGASLRPITQRKRGPGMLRFGGRGRRLSTVGRLVIACRTSTCGSLKVVYGARSRTHRVTSGLRVPSVGFLSDRDSTFIRNVIVVSTRVTGNLRFSRIVVPRISSEGCRSRVSQDVLCITMAETVRHLALACDKAGRAPFVWVFNLLCYRTKVGLCVCHRTRDELAGWQ